MKNKAEKLTTEYLHKRELYQNFTEAIKGILHQLLSGTEIKIYAISTRAKDPDKLEEKIIRKEKEGSTYKVLTDIEDLAGVRIVPYLESHKKEIADLVYREFEDADPKYEDKNKPNGYRGTHIILSLNSARLKLPEYSRYAGLKCEIQITSALYHTWSEIEHDIIYKSGQDKEKLKTLGLDEIEEGLRKIMSDHIDQASIHFDHIFKRHKEILKAGAVFFSDFLKDIKNAKTNEELISFLDIAEHFSHKKHLESIQMVEGVLSLDPIKPQLLGKIGSKKIYGKEHQDILGKCTSILGLYHIRYSDTPKILKLLFNLTKNKYSGIHSQALKALEELASFNSVFIEKYKTIYPQIETIKFIKNIPKKNRVENFKFISTGLQGVLSTNTEGSFMSKSDQLTFQSGTLSPNENIVRIRHEAINFIVQLLKETLSPKDRLELMRILSDALYPPSHQSTSDALIDMLVEDSKLAVKIFRREIFDGKKVKDYAIASRIEEGLNHLLRHGKFKIKEIDKIYDDLHSDNEYVMFHTLVGEIHKFKAPDEDWDVAEKRRTNAITELVAQTNESNIEEWHKRLTKYIQPFKNKIIEEWPYSSLKIYIAELTKSKPNVAFKLFEGALNKNSALALPDFIAPFLETLRNTNLVNIWDKFVQKIISKKRKGLTSAIVYSLNLRKEKSLTYIRDKDIKIITQIVKFKKPFNYETGNDFRLRHSVIGTLTRLYKKSPKLIEGLIVEEISKHPDMVNVYFSELPFSSHREWMNLSSWTPKGKSFMSGQLTKIKDLSWHTQEMLLEMYKPTIKPILKIFHARIKYSKEGKKDNDRYDAIPYDFNPSLKEHISNHPDYTKEVGNWLGEMTPKWSKYNWDVSHFIQRIGGASFQTIIRDSVKKGSITNLRKATYALEGLDQPDFEICMEIAGSTDNKGVLDRLSSIMYATGVVNGEDGLARAMKAKAESMDKFIESTDERIREFAKKMKKFFEERSQQEFNSATERRRFRELDFES
jgi:ppGpp synthetase/RelA/SpoT-type nucleotidyltranferase